MCVTTRHRLRGDTTSPRTARRISGSVITPLLGDSLWVAAFTDDTTIIVSELVTNAVEAGCVRLELSLTVHRSCVRVSVFDDAPGMPRVVAAVPTDVRGRGLVLIAALSRNWGVDLAPDGKQVWADLLVPVDLVTSGALRRCQEPALTRTPP